MAANLSRTALPTQRQTADPSVLDNPLYQLSHSCPQTHRERFRLCISAVPLHWIVHGHYQATILGVYPCWGRRVHAWHRDGELASFTEPSRRETMPTYAFCVLQTFHRLCKTSESVRPLKLWEGGGCGGGGLDRWTDKSGFAVIAGLAVCGLVRIGPITFENTHKNTLSGVKSHVISSQESFAAAVLYILMQIKKLTSAATQTDVCSMSVSYKSYNTNANTSKHTHAHTQIQ